MSLFSEIHHARGAIEDLARDLRLAVRRMPREPGYTLPAVATIALGIAVSTAVFTLANAVLLRPLPFEKAERLVDVGHAAPGAKLAVTGLSAGVFTHYRQGNRSFEGIGVYLEDVRALTDLGTPETVRVALADPGLFPTLRMTPHIGRLPTAEDFDFGVRNGLLISHDLWVRRYGADADIVGKTIEMDRRRDVVVGVAPPGFHFPHPETQVWLGWPADELDAHFGGPRANLRGLFMKGVARLRHGISSQDAERDLDRLVRTLPGIYPDVTAEELERMGLRAVVTPLKDTIVGDVRPALLLLLATAGFLLVITWANTTNLSLARAIRRRKEVAIHRSLGATNGRLARCFIIEGALMAAIGGILGLGLADAAVDLRFGFRPEQIPRLGEVVLDSAGVALAVSLALLTGILLAAISLKSALGSGSARAPVGAWIRGRRREQMQRRTLVTLQVAVACTVLVGSALMAQSYRRLKQVELGFRPEGAMTFFLPLPSDPYADSLAMSRLHREVLGRLRALPGVTAAETATVSAFPLTPVPDYYVDRAGAVGTAATETADRENQPHALVSLATAGYFQAMRIPLLQGRTFQPSDGGDAASEVILSASLARSLFGDEDASGRRVRLASTGRRSHTVVGVVGDVPSRTIQEGAAKALYFPNLYPADPDSAYGPRNEQYILRTGVQPLSLVAAVRRTIHEVDPKLVVMRVGTLEGLVDGSLARARLTMLLLLVGAATALFFGVIGVYGVLSYMVRRRASELSVRIALGASPAKVARMVMRQGAGLALGGIAIGLAGAVVLARFLRALLYQVSPSDPLVFIGAAALLLAVALAACWLPAHRAGQIDPVRSLRSE